MKLTDEQGRKASEISGVAVSNLSLAARSLPDAFESALDIAAQVEGIDRIIEVWVRTRDQYKEMLAEVAS